MLLQTSHLSLKLTNDLLTSLLSGGEVNTASSACSDVDHLLELRMVESLNWLENNQGADYLTNGHWITYLVRVNQPFYGCLLEEFVAVGHWLVFSGCRLEVFVH